MPSNYFSRFRGLFRQEIRRSFSGNESGIQDQVNVLIGQTKLTLHHLRQSHSLPSRTFTDSLLFEANLHVENRKKNISVIGAFSRVISIPSVSGPSLQVCGYHVDSLMAVCGSKPALPGSSISMLISKPAQLGLAANRSFSFYSKRNFGDFRKASMSLSNKEQPNNFLLYGYFIYKVAKRMGNGYSIPGFGFESLHISSPKCSSSGATPDVYFHSTIAEESNSSSADSSESNVTVERTLKLNSASCCLPHPDKEETGGEDAHFICTEEQAIGVADGVGGWADVGIDAGYYARQLMSYSVNAIQQEPKGSIDPARVLEKAHASTKAKGSSTACIIALTDQGLHAINLGDSGFMVVRDGCTVFRSPVQQHDFNFPYQMESGNSADLPSSGQVFNVAIAPGDVIIAGTDGLFDNLYNNDITAIVVHASRSGFGPQVTAQKIAALARQRALDKNRQTPFSSAAQEAGFRYYGGKLDDITVVVSYITTDHKEGFSAKSSN